MRLARRTVLDLVDDDALEGADITPGSDIEDEEAEAAESGGNERREHRRLLEMAREAEMLRGEVDAKLQQGTAVVQALLKDGYSPIVFCRFIPTAEYVAEALRQDLPKDVAIEAVTVRLPPVEREIRVGLLGRLRDGSSCAPTASQKASTYRTTSTQ